MLEYLLFVNHFLSVVLKKKPNLRFSGFEPGTKISLAIRRRPIVKSVV